MNTKTAKTRILAGEFDAALSRLYGDARVPAQRIRYANAAASFEQLYGDRDVAFFSVPGRTEIIGNHTDHNNGRVIAASVDIDIIAVAAKTDDNTVRVKSEGYREDVVQLCDLDPTAIKTARRRQFSQASQALSGTTAETTAALPHIRRATF